MHRLAPVLQAGFSVTNGCFCLRETDGGLVIGLSQMPSPKILREIHDRLSGYPIFFQSLTQKDAGLLRELLKPSTAKT